ncbi:MAG: PQQ-binding-like beta-propeller repeat protein, partial [Planctomycetia bacterium]
MQRPFFSMLLLLIACCAEVTGEEAAPWPQRRGVHWDAIAEEAGPVEPWLSSRPPIIWSRSLGRSYSGFTAADRRLYTQSQTLTRQTVECLDPRTGKTVWQYPYDWPFDPAGLYPGPRATPTWYGGKVYFVSPDLLVGCVDGRSGKRVWERNLGAEYTSRGTEFGYACSPTIVDGRLILPLGAKGACVIALDPSDGSTVWTTEGRHPASYCSAIPIRFDDRSLAIVILRNDVLMLDVGTGKVVWEKKLSSGYDEHSAAPLWEVIDETGYLVIAQPFQAGAKCFTFKIKSPEKDGPVSKDSAPLPSLEVKLAWTCDGFSNDTASSVLYRGHVYGFDLQDVQAKKHRASKGVFKCLDVTDGHVCWESDRPGHATVLVADEKLLLWNDSGEFILARATPEKYDELARATVFSNEVCWTAPTFYDGRVFLRSPTRVACLALRETPGQVDYQLPAGSWTDWIDLRALVAGERPYMMDPPDG